jgi:hypothetical protein
MSYQVNYTPRCHLKDIPIGGYFLAHGDCVYMRIGGEEDPFKCFRLAPLRESGSAWSGSAVDVVLPIKVDIDWGYPSGEYDLDPWDIPIGDCFTNEDDEVFLQLTNWGAEDMNRCFRLTPEPKFMIIRLPKSDFSDFNPLPKVQPIDVTIKWSPQ